jgi:hypothetical protein
VCVEQDCCHAREPQAGVFAAAKDGALPRLVAWHIPGGRKSFSPGMLFLKRAHVPAAELPASIANPAPDTLVPSGYADLG